VRWFLRPAWKNSEACLQILLSNYFACSLQSKSMLVQQVCKSMMIMLLQATQMTLNKLQYFILRNIAFELLTKFWIPGTSHVESYGQFYWTKICLKLKMWISGGVHWKNTNTDKTNKINLHDKKREQLISALAVPVHFMAGAWRRV
jgi:hypothetical protein